MVSVPARPAAMRFTAAAGLLLAAGLTLVASGQGKDLRLVSTVWPPFTNLAGQPRFALDLVEDSLRVLLDGKADYTLMDAPVVQYILENHPEEAKTRCPSSSASTPSSAP